MLPRFRCLVPTSKKEALSMLNQEGGARVLAGGTDLLVDIRKYTCCPETLGDITKVAEFSAERGAGGRLGPLCTHAYIAADNYLRRDYPALARACGYVGSPQIRNMATIAGNIANACPAADTVPPLLIHDCVLTIESLGGGREVRLEGFIVGAYKSSLMPDELITSIKAAPLSGYSMGLRRLSIRAALSISRLSVAWAFKVEGGVFEDARIAVGSCTPVAFRARDAEDFLRGRKYGEETAEEAAQLVVNRVKTTVGERPTHAFKLPIIRNILLEALEDVCR